MLFQWRTILFLFQKWVRGLRLIIVFLPLQSAWRRLRQRDHRSRGHRPGTQVSGFGKSRGFLWPNWWTWSGFDRDLPITSRLYSVYLRLSAGSSRLLPSLLPTASTSPSWDRGEMEPHPQPHSSVKENSLASSSSFTSSSCVLLCRSGSWSTVSPWLMRMETG